MGLRWINPISNICKAPPQYLKMVNEAYINKYEVYLEHALKKELKGKAESAAVYHLNTKLSPYKKMAEHIKSTCAMMGTDELWLSCAILRYRYLLPQVMMEHTSCFGKTVQERVKSETKGDFEKLLLEMIRVAWPDAP